MAAFRLPLLKISVALNIGLILVVVFLRITHGPNELSGDSGAHSPTTSTVEEIFYHSQALQMDGQPVVLRGWFDTDPGTGEFHLYHSSWDPFEPESRHSIPSIALRFPTKPVDADYWTGQYLNVQGTLATEPLASGKRNVLLQDARIVSVRMNDDHRIPIPYRMPDGK